MDAFFRGLGDELTKLARLPTGEPRKPSGRPVRYVKFNTKKYNQMWDAEAARVRRRRLLKAKGGSGLQAPKKGKWINAPPPADKPVAKKRRGKAKPKVVATPSPARPPDEKRITRVQSTPQENPKYRVGVNYKVTQKRWADEKARKKRVLHKRTFHTVKPPETKPPRRISRIKFTPKAKGLASSGKGTVTPGDPTLRKRMPIPPPTGADRLRKTVTKYITKPHTGWKAPPTAAKP